MKKGLSLFLFAICCIGMAMAQNDDRPGWTHNTPKAGNNTYVYVVERGGGTTVNEAINNALLKVLRTTMMRIGAVVSWDEVNSSLQNGTDWGTVAMKYNIPVNKVCECVEQKTENGYRVAVLCQVAKSGNVYPDFDEFTGCSDVNSYSNGAAALKSVFLPGLGQMSKNHDEEGALTLAGEIVLLGGDLICYFYGKSCISDMATYSNNPYLFNKYLNQYENVRKANLVFGAAAAALYVYNIFRAYTMKPKYKSDVVLLEPTLMQTDLSWAAGLGLTFNF